MIEVGDTIWQLANVIHAGATWFLVGLIWTIQVVHYPSFDAIDPATYNEFQQRHMTKMGSLVGPPWLVEGVLVLVIFVTAPTAFTIALAVVGGLLEAVVIGVTLRASIPAHEALTSGFEPDAHRVLLRTNWLRTWAWSGRGLIALVLLWTAF